MTDYVALLRAVNVGGTGKLPMAELKAIGEACGFANVRTFIASGNLLFASEDGEAAVQRAVEERLDQYFGKKIELFVRSGAEMAAIAADNPFADRPGNRTIAYFMAAPPTKDVIVRTKGIAHEEIALGTRELYIAYGDGMGQSKLRLPTDAIGTARNMNSVAKMAAMLA